MDKITNFQDSIGRTSADLDVYKSYGFALFIVFVCVGIIMSDCKNFHDTTNCLDAVTLDDDTECEKKSCHKVKIYGTPMLALFAFGVVLYARWKRDLVYESKIISNIQALSAEGDIVKSFLGLSNNRV